MEVTWLYVFYSTYLSTYIHVWILLFQIYACTVTFLIVVFGQEDFFFQTKHLKIQQNFKPAIVYWGLRIAIQTIKSRWDSLLKHVFFKILSVVYRCLKVCLIIWKKNHTLYFEPDLGKLGVQLLGRSCKKHTVAGYKIW